MTATELIAQLEDLVEAHGDLEVSCISSYGDRCNTQQALPALGVDIAPTKSTAYSESGTAIIVEDDFDSYGDYLEACQESEESVFALFTS